MSNNKIVGTRWMFTYNNYVLVDEPSVWFKNGDGDIKFITWEPEEAPSTGTPHLQGYLVLKPNPRNKNGRTKKWMIDNISKACDWRVARGSHAQCIAYCNKEGNGITLGGHQDGRIESTAVAREKKASVLNEVRDLIIAGVEDEVLWREYFGIMMRHSKALKDFRLTLPSAQRDHQTKLLIITGPPGTGKSHLARKIAKAQCGGGYYFASPDNGKLWFDGYDPKKKIHRVGVIEEFDGSMMKPGTFLRLADKYPMRCETKGANVEIDFDLLIVTTNKLPRDLWSLEALPADRYDALLRRCSGSNGAIIHMTEKYVAPEDEKTFDFKDIVADLAEGRVDVNNVAINNSIDDDNDAPPHFAPPLRASYEETSQDYVDDDWADEPDENDDLGIDDLTDAADDLEYEEERYGGDTQPLGTSGRKRLSGGVIDLSADDVELEWQQPKRMKRTQPERSAPTSSLSIEKQVDKRWGKQPVQAKIRFPKPLAARNLDDDFDDK